MRQQLLIVLMTGLLTVTSTTIADTGLRWAIALHGGAGRLSPDMSDDLQAEYHQALQSCLTTGVEVLKSGGTALDATERTVMALEDCPLFNAGRGAVFDREGAHEMDASIMDGSTLACGGVASVTTLRNPIQGARVVMEKTPHVLIGGVKAELLSAAHGATLAPKSYFSTGHRFEQLQKSMREAGLTPPGEPLHGWPPEVSRIDGAGELEVGGTVGCCALDSHGDLAAATSTGGGNNKLPGRIGDSPIPGAGNYANSAVAVGGTGKGEEYLRHFVAGRVAWLVESETMELDEAAQHVLRNVLKPGDGGLIAVDHEGAITMRTTTGSMPSAAADSDGRSETKIWYD